MLGEGSDALPARRVDSILRLYRRGCWSGLRRPWNLSPPRCSILFFRGTESGVDNSQILSIFLRGALGSRGRKRARRAANFLSGNAVS